MLFHRTKVVKIIKCICTVFIDNFRNIFQLIHRYRCQFVGEVMTDMLSIKEMIQCASLGIPKGMKNAVFISIAFYLDCFIRNENITSEEWKKKRLK